MTAAFIGLGANLGDPANQLRSALQRLAELDAIKLVKQSSLYRTAPLGPAGQPHYCNAVAELQTSLSARALLRQLLNTEKAMGRTRDAERWGPRRIDLDLLVFGDDMINEPGLQVPHPEMHKRNFVLLPLAEIAPQLQIPGLGQVGDLAASVGAEGIEFWSEANG
ncbi:MAG: 2-amino-4-hydroxy-6-hydroxymethyldihydropteridine diphosphokinase [Salinisphaeraceae bacterium]|nr:2-amino-4-hydroxy-6-hydroxymethyldihydropteridine diphosphokinase [Salinisphaeraceae bacterium]